MGKVRRIKHLLSDDGRITTCNNDLEFIQFVNRIQNENEDEHTYDVDSCVNYINEFCDNLEIVVEVIDNNNGLMEFTYYLDVKHSIWTRTYFTVEASSGEEADEIAKRMYREDEIDLYGWEPLIDTIEDMTLEENGGASTHELYTDDGTIIYQNGEG